MTNRKRLNRANHYAYKVLKQIQKAITACNAMGFTVRETIIPERGKPRLVVDDCPAGRERLKTMQAWIYKSEGGNQERIQTARCNVEGIYVEWRVNQ
ncbi:hypothetical protein [Pasteurella multocida]|uniref:hypothetical protein n=1 Tax=Pasteurella multocida TaxID=747 RepID=UPI002930ED41|nr:hypothetical protein [Pasteurella multocida]WNY75944.1 hypothetical protein H2513_08680 [Pasteurella multocida]